MMELVITRSQWLHGEGRAKSRLCRQEDGKKCCLGFLALRCGVDLRTIVERATLWFLQDNQKHDLPVTMEFLLTEDRKADSPVADMLMVINDTMLGGVACTHQYDDSHPDFEMTSEAVREVKISEILAEHGFTLTFVD